jgi:integrase
MSMPRSVSLKPAFRDARKNAGLAPWVVNVPKELSPTGNRQELFFATKTSAQGECDRLQAKKKNFGNSLSLLSPAQLIEAAKSYELIKPFGVGLLEAIREYVAIHEQRIASIRFLDLCNRYIDAKAGRDERHLKGLRQTCNRFPTLHAMLVTDIDSRVLEPLVTKVPPGGRNLILRHFRAFFNYAIKKKWAVENPVDRLDFVEVVRKEVEVVATNDVQKMFNDALQNDLQLVPYLTLGFFCGIRPEEIRLMRWDDLDVATKGVTIRPEVSKTRKRRFPELSDNAVLWLQAYAQAGGEMKGPITNLGEDSLFAHRQKNRLNAGVTEWPNSGMRHTFCSNWLATNKDVNKLVLLSGHDNPDTMWSHYHRGVKESEAKKFWAIAPPSAENVIPFQQNKS